MAGSSGPTKTTPAKTTPMGAPPKDTAPDEETAPPEETEQERLDRLEREEADRRQKADAEKAKVAKDGHGEMTRPGGFSVVNGQLVWEPGDSPCGLCENVKIHPTATQYSCEHLTVDFTDPQLPGLSK